MHGAETALTQDSEANPAAQYASGYFGHRFGMSHLPPVFLLHSWTDAHLLHVGYWIQMLCSMSRLIVNGLAHSLVGVLVVCIYMV